MADLGDLFTGTPPTYGVQMMGGGRSPLFDFAKYFGGYLKNLVGQPLPSYPGQIDPGMSPTMSGLGQMLQAFSRSPLPNIMGQAGGVLGRFMNPSFANPMARMQMMGGNAPQFFGGGGMQNPFSNPGLTNPFGPQPPMQVPPGLDGGPRNIPGLPPWMTPPWMQPPGGVGPPTGEVPMPGQGPGPFVSPPLMSPPGPFGPSVTPSMGVDPFRRGPQSMPSNPVMPPSSDPFLGATMDANMGMDPNRIGPRPPGTPTLSFPAPPPPPMQNITGSPGGGMQSIGASAVTNQTGGGPPQMGPGVLPPVPPGWSRDDTGMPVPPGTPTNQMPNLPGGPRNPFTPPGAGGMSNIFSREGGFVPGVSRQGGMQNITPAPPPPPSGIKNVYMPATHPSRKPKSPGNDGSKKKSPRTNPTPRPTPRIFGSQN